MGQLRQRGVKEHEHHERAPHHNERCKEQETSLVPCHSKLDSRLPPTRITSDDKKRRRPNENAAFKITAAVTVGGGE